MYWKGVKIGTHYYLADLYPILTRQKTVWKSCIYFQKKLQFPVAELEEEIVIITNDNDDVNYLAGMEEAGKVVLPQEDFENAVACGPRVDAFNKIFNRSALSRIVKEKEDAKRLIDAKKEQAKLNKEAKAAAKNEEERRLNILDMSNLVACKCKGVCANRCKCKKDGQLQDICNEFCSCKCVEKEECDYLNKGFILYSVLLFIFTLIY
jgi:hypothetical protein